MTTRIDGSEIAMSHLKDFTNASAVSTIYEFVSSLETVNTTLYTMKSQTNELRVYASQLNDGEIYLLIKIFLGN